MNRSLLCLRPFCVLVSVHCVSSQGMTGRPRSRSAGWTKRRRWYRRRVGLIERREVDVAREEDSDEGERMTRHQAPVAEGVDLTAMMLVMVEAEVEMAALKRGLI